MFEIIQFWMFLKKFKWKLIFLPFWLLGCEYLFSNQKAIKKEEIRINADIVESSCGNTVIAICLWEEML